MDTTDQVITTLGETSGTQFAPTPTGCGGSNVSGGLDIDAFASKNAKMFFWATVIMGGVMVLLILLLLFGRLHFGKTTTSTYASSFTPKAVIGGSRSNFGNYPNWYMQDGCAGYNCSVDTSSGRSLGFGVSDFETNKKNNFAPLPGVRSRFATPEAQRAAAAALLKSNMDANKQREHLVAEQRRQENLRLPRQNVVSHMANKENMTPAEAKAQEDAARAYIAARTLSEVGGRQAQVLAGCNNSWDPMATEEAKVLGAVGVFKPNTPGMSSFSKAINDNVPLTDAQLEAIMQGGEPMQVGPVGFNQFEQLAAQTRTQETQMAAPRRFV